MDPAQSPRTRPSATLVCAAPSGIALSATLLYVGNQYDKDLQTDVLSAALIVDGTATLPISSALRLVARGENIFDEKVVTRNDDGSIDLGTPRTLWIGLRRSEEHTSELQSLMRISYAVFCLKKKTRY